MKIKFNQGEIIEVNEGMSLLDFLNSKNLNRDGVAVAIDDEIVKKADFKHTVLKDGMAVDVFNMVCGG
ncbi:MAG: sulfur carrier protein ThiS [Succinivibrio sp.]